ncbi:Phage major capsid protein [Rhodovulum sp. P5]|uniref:Mu-like prophage major head subunit gpT family protein n=1 Tax=Rhodovulum sp. P5 TaxID=1564506 RepID=UPI0009C3C98C|nr:Mu-like prophage major head subunit gpT family protein [Rhodovulum sp. P5]ARE38350.1 Phage major capsid protein [Rhodovulum sp. P5]
MDIAASALDEMFSGFNTVFNNALNATSIYWNKIAMDVKSTGADETYGWLASVPQMREWLGERHIRAVGAARYTLENRKFESTMRVQRDHIEDDRLGVYAPQLTMMAHAAATHPDELVFEVLKRGFAETCYDGQFFFDTDHPVEDTDGDAQSVSNFQGGSDTPWFLLDTSRPVKPLVFQTRVPYKLQTLTRDEDHNVFMRDEFLYGVRARVNAGYGLWQFAYGSKQVLNATNYAAARAAMQALRYDGGRIIGVTPTVLVVPPSLEAAGRALLLAEELEGGGANIWHRSADLLVSPYLQDGSP